jgi:hypothetical protein
MAGPVSRLTSSTSCWPARPKLRSTTAKRSSTRVSIGWSRRVGYWVHPVLRLVGPLPATAWLASSCTARRCRCWIGSISVSRPANSWRCWARVKAIVTVDRPYPRHRDDPVLQTLRREILELMGFGGA